MRWALLILGSLLIVQVLLRALTPMFQDEFSFEKMGAAVDLVKLTAGLCAVSLADLLKRRSELDSI